MMKQFIRVLSSTNALIILAIVFIVSFFTVPYLFPPKEMVNSMSYDYGFNNQVGVLLVGLSILVFGAIGYLRNNIDLNIFIKDSERLPFRHFVFGLIFCILFFTCVSLSGRYVLEFNDSSYFFYHFYEMTLGRIPYKDFAFGYGPLTIYFPYWVYSLMPEFSTLNAYIFSLSIFHIIGLYAIYELVNVLNIKRIDKIWMFWIAFLIFFPYTIGMNYQAFRFVFPFWAMWKCHILQFRWKFLFIPLSVLITLAFSPEIGLVYWIASLIYSGLQLYVSRNSKYCFVIALTLFINSIFVFAFKPMFTFVLSFGSGFLNLPFIPSFHLLVFFLCIFVIAYYLGGVFPLLDKYVLEISFILLACGLIPVCLGRCDPGHVIYNGFFIISLSVVLIIKMLRRLRLPLLCLVLLLYVNLSFTVPFSIPDFFKVAICNQISIIHDYRAELKYDNSSVNESILPMGEKVTVPFFSNYEDYYYLCSKDKVNEMYFTRTTCRGTTGNVHKMVNELKEDSPRVLLLYRGWENVIAPNNSYDSLIKYLFFTYYPVYPYRNGNLVNKPLIDYIKKNYKKVNGDKNYLIYERNTAEDLSNEEYIDKKAM